MSTGGYPHRRLFHLSFLRKRDLASACILFATLSTIANYIYTNLFKLTSRLISEIGCPIWHAVMIQLLVFIFYLVAFSETSTGDAVVCYDLTWEIVHHLLIYTTDHGVVFIHR